jgi:hypothetical protein
MRAPAHPGGKPTSRSRRSDPIMQAWDSNELRRELELKTTEFLKLLGAQPRPLLEWLSNNSDDHD